MGAALAACNEGVRKLLMPAAGSCTSDFTGFGEPEPDCLLLIGNVGHATFSQEASSAFFAEGLGANPAQSSAPGLHFGAGPTELALSAATSEPQETSTWPGQFYVWVEDIQTSWDACRSLGNRLGADVVESAICCHDERQADALVLREPGSANVVMVNQAPKGYAKMARKTQRFKDPEGGQASSNLLCLMDVLCHVPPGTAASIASFYEQVLSARVTRTSDGCRLHFACGEALRQSLSFAEEDSAESAWEPSAARGRQVCLYMPTEVKFRSACAECTRLGLVTEARQGEFSIAHCVDPATGKPVLELSHVIRSPYHPECPVSSSGPKAEDSADVHLVDASAMGA